MPTGRKQTYKVGQRDRLSERTSQVDDAIVGSHGNKNHEKLAEMTSSFGLTKGNRHEHNVRRSWIV